MRKPHKFLLTVLVPDDNNAELCGRVEYITTGHQATFGNLEDLVHFLHDEINASNAARDTEMQPKQRIINILPDDDAFINQNP
ncbi:MAG: hypothetical protein M1281_06080 [Chloroflexi bacterium]|nr:hypothetical protein [Chloroflexota bacterium]